LLSAAAVLLPVGYGVALALKPAPKLPVNETTLFESVQAESGSAGELFDEAGTCTARRRGIWHCSVLDREGSGGADYRVQVPSGDSCWTARLVSDYSEGGMPERVTGCVRGDRWSPWDLVL
jgi:hypothetical protein